MFSMRCETGSAAASLSHAILLYSSGKQASYGESEGTATHATVHEVEKTSTGPVIMPGRLLTENDMAELVKGLAESDSAAAPKWIDPNILAMGAGRMVWFTPPGRRAMFFKKSSHNPETMNGRGILPCPGLVWMSTSRALHVYAVKGADRPKPSTRLYQAPFFNVWSRGQVCIGSASLPADERKHDTLAWEKTFFGSRFTHPNFTEPDRLVRGIEAITFWKKMLARPPAKFPEARLVELPLAVEDLVAVDVGDRLSRIRQAKGEF
jgi:PRTRC genetic system protein B